MCEHESPWFINVYCTTGGKHTWQPSLFVRESPILEAFLLISPYFLPFFEYNFLFDKHWPKMMIFYCKNTRFTVIFGVSVINKQSAEDNDFIVLCVIFEVMGGNLQNMEVKQLNQIKPRGHL